MPGISTFPDSQSRAQAGVFTGSAGGMRPVILSRDLYGFVPADYALENEPAFLRPFHCIRSGRVAALAGPPGLRLPLGGRVRRALGRLRTYQRVLEQVMRRAPVLPARFGCRLPDRSTTQRLMRRNEERLAQAICAFGHLRQFELQVTGPRVEPGTGSRLLAAREHVRLELKSFCIAVREESTGSAGTLLRLTVLIRPLDEPRFDAALARLDGEFGGWLGFSCVGPLPPCNFVRAAISPAATGPLGWTLTLTSTLPATLWPPLALHEGVTFHAA